jgi:cystathionine beta-lyase/cystathionine gamma-synthase
VKANTNDATCCVHAGEASSSPNSSLCTDIVQTAVFVMPSVNELRRYAEGDSTAYMYTRYGNPTTAAAERKIATLEGADACVVTASGMAAEMALTLALLKTGDEIVSMLDIYGGTSKLFENVLTRYGINTHFVPFHELDNVERYFTPRTRMLFLETPTNPTLRCVDIEGLARVAHRHRAVCVVDSTFATPILQKPIALGADFVVHSATKYLGGHNDLTAGAVAGPNEWMGSVREMMKLSGGCLDPLASYLLIRGLKTLDIRVERACRNAREVARFLCSHPKVARVFYPGLPGHQGHEVARRQMKDFGMMVSFEVKGGGAAAEKLIDALQLWHLATSLGGVESTSSYPVLSSHVGLSDDRLRQLDVSPATVRLSVGIEDASDLTADLGQALERM